MCSLRGKASFKSSPVIFSFLAYKFWVGGLYFEGSIIGSLIMFFVFFQDLVLCYLYLVFNVSNYQYMSFKCPLQCITAALIMSPTVSYIHS